MQLCTLSDISIDTLSVISFSDKFRVSNPQIIVFCYPLSMKPLNSIYTVLIYIYLSLSFRNSLNMRWIRPDLLNLPE